MKTAIITIGVKIDVMIRITMVVMNVLRKKPSTKGIMKSS